jgi:SAM-dependent methyltransferase
MSDFLDLFSRQAAAYAKYRPRYPKELFEYLASLPTVHERAWDCGTGNGQAAVGLAPYFQEVIATDPSAAQIGKAQAHPKISYRIEPAEKTTLAPASVDLLTVAQAAHWFKFDEFYAEARRTLKPGGVIALWTYGHNRKMDSVIDPILEHYSSRVVGQYWPPEIQLVWDNYQTMPFPFEELSAPKLTIQSDFDLAALLGYLSSWSSTARYIEVEKKNPLLELERELTAVWGRPESRRTMVWQIYFRVGRHMVNS